MWIPPGFAHGFVVTSESADFAYKVTANYAPADERSIQWDDPALAIAWPKVWPAAGPILSRRDVAAPSLAASELPTYAP
jgi:dTDP-4-dehydrorhamnose 3,5-epimerase